MKKIKQSISRKIPPIKLYLNDLEEIINIFKEGDFSEIKISTKNQELNENELGKIPKSEFIETITVLKPSHISIHFNNQVSGGGFIYTENDSPLMERVTGKLEK